MTPPSSPTEPPCRIPDAWAWVAAADAARAGLVLVVGAPDRGKSTFVRWLVGELATRGEPVGWLDGDLGQPALGVPATQTLAVVAGFLAGLPVPAARFFVGDTTPRGHMLPTLVGLARLVEEARRLGARSVVVDTTGLVAASAGGGALKEWKIELLRPSLVVALEAGGELGHFLDPVRREGRFPVLTPEPASGVRRRSPEERSARRSALFQGYFGGAGRQTVPDRVAVHGPLPIPPGALVGLQGPGGLCLGLGVALGSRHGALEVATPLASLEPVTSLRVGAVRLDRSTFAEVPRGLGATAAEEGG